MGYVIAIPVAITQKPEIENIPIDSMNKNVISLFNLPRFRTFQQSYLPAYP